MDDLDLDQDSPLAGLRKEATPVESEIGLDTELDAAWRAVHGIPDVGYRIVKQYGLYQMELWKVRFLSKAGPPSWCHAPKGTIFVRYENTECLWRGKNAPEPKVLTTKCGKPITVYRGRLDSFELTLTDAVCRLGQYRDEFRRDRAEYIHRQREDIRRIEKEIETSTAYIRDLDAFRPADCVPSDLLDEEDRAIEAAFADIDREDDRASA
jgi:hypothetical protein